jgi:hypothetical protein
VRRVDRHVDHRGVHRALLVDALVLLAQVQVDFLLRRGQLAFEGLHAGVLRLDAGVGVGVRLRQRLRRRGVGVGVGRSQRCRITACTWPTLAASLAAVPVGDVGDAAFVADAATETVLDWLATEPWPMATAPAAVTDAPCPIAVPEAAVTLLLAPMATELVATVAMLAPLPIAVPLSAPTFAPEPNAVSVTSVALLPAPSASRCRCRSAGRGPGRFQRDDAAGEVVRTCRVGWGQRGEPIADVVIAPPWML